MHMVMYAALIKHSLVPWYLDATGASKSVILGKICLPSASGNDVGAMFRR